MYMLMNIQITLHNEWLITQYTEVWPLPTMYALMFLQGSLVSEWLITQITEIWPLPTMYALMFLQISLMTEWLITHYRNMAASHYVWADVSSDNTSYWMIYYIYRRNTAAPRNVLVPVHSEHSAKRDEIIWKILLWREISLKSKYNIRLSGYAWVGVGGRYTVCVRVCVCEWMKVQLQFHYVTI
jgi:hypothetical protein